MKRRTFRGLKARVAAQSAGEDAGMHHYVYVVLLDGKAAKSPKAEGQSKKGCVKAMCLCGHDGVEAGPTVPESQAGHQGGARRAAAWVAIIAGTLSMPQPDAVRS